MGSINQIENWNSFTHSSFLKLSSSDAVDKIDAKSSKWDLWHIHTSDEINRSMVHTKLQQIII